MKKELIIRYKNTQNGFLAEGENCSKVYEISKDPNKTREECLRKSLYDIGGEVIPDFGLFENTGIYEDNGVNYIKIIVSNKPITL